VSAKSQPIPDPAVRRLSLYLRVLSALAADGAENVSSQRLAEMLQLTSAQVRKDLGYFGQFGRPGVGYRVADLMAQLRRILGTDRTRKVILVGAGDLGRALMRYKGFAKRGFEIVAGLDVSEAKIGRTVNGVPIRPMSELDTIVRQNKVDLAVVVAPAEAAQEVVAKLCQAGVKGILNFAPTTLQVPDGVAVGMVDLASHLEQLSFQVASQEP